MASLNWDKASKKQLVKEKGSTWRNERGFKKPSSKRKRESNGTLLASKFKSYCSICHYTIWVNEVIRYFNGGAEHLDCKKAIADDTPRVMDSRWERIYGKVTKSSLKAIL